MKQRVYNFGRMDKENFQPVGSLQTLDGSFLKLSSVLTMCLKGVEAYGVESMREDDFVSEYKNDPIFRRKIDLMFAQGTKLVKNKAELIVKQKQRVKLRHQNSQFQKGTTYKSWHVNKLLNFLDVCERLKTCLGKEDM